MPERDTIWILLWWDKDMVRGNAEAQF